MYVWIVYEIDCGDCNFYVFKYESLAKKFCFENDNPLMERWKVQRCMVHQDTISDIRYF